MFNNLYKIYKYGLNYLIIRDLAYLEVINMAISKNDIIYTMKERLFEEDLTELESPWKSSFGYYSLNPEKFVFGLRDINN
ncbi:hypothetical protein LCGC14_1471000 [marine sediment metagenome]|uniref:Uncharacterized protein n=1 Tax=marine sediment metagenome TaxID=412755 RepID=A0A0F9LSU4_9ZZZZ